MAICLAEAAGVRGLHDRMVCELYGAAPRPMLVQSMGSCCAFARLGALSAIARGHRRRGVPLIEGSTSRA